MALVQEPEVQLAQKLASNEKPIRAKALRKLRKYINVRSQKETDGFSSDELLKLWKGLFYCLWMQDKPLLQEELSSQISNLIHSFHSVDSQLLYLESCLLTFKREWTGIDRLRMDKFFQMMRFMFRHSFEMLKRRNWDKSAVGRFLQLLSAQLLQNGSEAPMGLQFHILDLYMTELAAVGASELTADQNLMFIEPFIKTASKTKNRTLFNAICSSIFSSIIDQAPFAIEDLMKEMGEGDSDSDSGQASEEESPVMEKQSKPPMKRGRGDKFHDDEDNEEMPCEEDMGPVLQFDYAALADKVFEFARRGNAPSYNRQRLYKIIKALKDLGEGIFPQDEYPEEVSTDEDDDMFGSRKRMKKGKRSLDEGLNGSIAATKTKGKKREASTPHGLNQDKDGEQVDQIITDGERTKKKKKKMVQGGDEKPELTSAQSPQQVTEICNTEATPQFEGAGDLENKAEVRLSSSIVNVPEQPSVTEKDEAVQPMSCDQEPPVEDGSAPNSEKQQTPLPVSGGKKRKKKRKSCETKDLSPVITEAEISCGAIAEETLTSPTTQPDDVAPKKRKQKKSKMARNKTEESEVKSQIDGASSEDNVTCEDSANNDTITKSKEASDDVSIAREETNPKVDENLSEDSPHTTRKKKRKLKVAASPVVDNTSTPPENTTEKEADTVVNNKETMEKSLELPHEAQQQIDVGAELQSDAVSSSCKRPKKKKKIPVVFEFEADELADPSLVSGLAQEGTVAKRTKLQHETTPGSLKNAQKKSKKASKSDFITFQRNSVAPVPLFCKTKGLPSTPLSSKTAKNCETPNSESKKVTFSLKNNKTAEFRKTDRSLLVNPVGSSRVPFDPTQKPKFGVLKSPPGSSAIKTPSNVNKKKSVQGVRKQRPSAADFF